MLEKLPPGASHRFLLLTAAILFPVALLIAQVRAELIQHDPTADRSLHRYLYESPQIGGLPFKSRAFPRWIIVTTDRFLRSANFQIPADKLDLALQIVSLWIGLIATTALARRWLEPSLSLTAAFLVALWSCWGFLSLGYNAGYPYDFPALMFSALGLLAIAKNRFWPLVVILAAGTLNKETTFWLIPAFAAHRALSLRWRTLMFRAAILLLAFLAAYQSTRLIAGNFPSEATLRQRTLTASFFTSADRSSPRLLQNLRELVFLGRGGIAQNVWWPLLIHIPAIIFYRRVPHDFRRLLWGLPFFLIPMFLVGNIWEVRIFLEILPLGAIGTLYVLSQPDPARIDESATYSKTA